jgi:apolipoprotein D and lipocalin family protein
MPTIGRVSRTGALGAWLLLLVGCASAPPTPLPPAPIVDLPRFMGDWYVIACIPTPIERDAVDAVESYRLEADGTVATTFRYRKGTRDGALKVYHPRGFVRRGTGNAEWGMQFLWPFQADYRVLAVSPTYEWTVIGRSARDYAWIMARQPAMSPADYAAAEQVMTSAGYRLEQVRHVPQTPLAARRP